MSIVKLSDWGIEIGKGKPLFFILGLNVLEDEKLAISTTPKLKKAGPHWDRPFLWVHSTSKFELTFTIFSIPLLIKNRMTGIAPVI